MHFYTKGRCLWACWLGFGLEQKFKLGQIFWPVQCCFGPILDGKILPNFCPLCTNPRTLVLTKLLRCSWCFLLTECFSKFRCWIWFWIRILGLYHWGCFICFFRGWSYSSVLGQAPSVVYIKLYSFFLNWKTELLPSRSKKNMVLNSICSSIAGRWPNSLCHVWQHILRTDRTYS